MDVRLAAADVRGHAVSQGIYWNAMHFCIATWASRERLGPASQGIPLGYLGELHVRLGRAYPVAIAHGFAFEQPLVASEQHAALRRETREGGVIPCRMIERIVAQQAQVRSQAPQMPVQHKSGRVLKGPSFALAMRIDLVRAPRASQFVPLHELTRTYNTRDLGMRNAQAFDKVFDRHAPGVGELHAAAAAVTRRKEVPQ